MTTYQMKFNPFTSGSLTSDNMDAAFVAITAADENIQFLDAEITNGTVGTRTVTDNDATLLETDGTLIMIPNDTARLVLVPPFTARRVLIIHGGASNTVQITMDGGSVNGSTSDITLTPYQAVLLSGPSSGTDWLGQRLLPV